MAFEYSLLAPTRQRQGIVPVMLDSVRTYTKNKENIEVLFAIDNDDIETLTSMKNYIVERYKDLNVRYFRRDRTEMLNNDYYNWLAGFSTGKYIWIIADDVRLKVMNWDIIISTKIESFLENKPDRILGVGIRDNTPPPKRSLPDFPCFPLVTREAYNLMGFILHPFVPTWGADYLFYLLYNGAGRYLPISDIIYLDHVSWHNKTAPKDVTARRIQDIFARLQHVQHHNIDYNAARTIPGQSAKIREYINKFGK